MNRARVASVAVAALAVSVVALPTGGVSSAATKPAITFSTLVVDPVHTFGEPGVSVADNGDVYVHGPWGTGTQRSLWERSVDGGRTYRPLHSAPISSANESATHNAPHSSTKSLTTHTAAPGGGDTEISIDHTGKV
jgi:hypothetical protein